MDYTLENALIVTEKGKDNTNILKVYADRIIASKNENEKKEGKKNA